MMEKEIIELKQKSIEQFYSHGGKMKQGDFFRRCPFTRDPRYIGYPFPISMNLKNRRETNGLICSSHLFDSELKLAGKSLDNRVNYTGVSILKFDNEGSLFAVCESNGHIRVYDFDECLAFLQLRSEKHVEPVRCLSLKREVADICWSLDNPNEMAVSFVFRPEIYIYDLEKIISSENISPKHSLKLYSGGGGHTKLMYWKDAGSEKSESVVAGSSTGYIRWWEYKNGTFNKCKWSVLGDSQRSAQTASPIIGLQIIQNKNGRRNLLVATAGGIFTTWDVNKLQYATFGCHPQPTSLGRFDLSLTLFCSMPTRSEISVLGFCPEKKGSDRVIVTLSNGDVFLLDTQSGRLVSSRKEQDCTDLLRVRKTIRNSTSNEPQSFSYEQLLQIQQQENNNNSSKILNHHFSPAIIPKWHGSVVMLAVPPSHNNEGSSLVCLNFDTRFDNVDINSHFSSISSLGDVTTGLMNRFLKRSSEISFTLQGFIMEAENGSRDLFTSQDLTPYLISLSAANTTNNKSYELFIDWSLDSVFSSPDNIIKTHEHSETFTIQEICGCNIRLNQCYQGPTIRNGSPKVSLRTSLIPTSRSEKSSTYVARSSSRVFVGSDKSEFGRWPVNNVLNFQPGNTITVIHPHSFLPCILVGFGNGSIQLLHLSSKKDDEFQNVYENTEQESSPLLTDPINCNLVNNIKFENNLIRNSTVLFSPCIGKKRKVEEGEQDLNERVKSGQKQINLEIRSSIIGKSMDARIDKKSQCSKLIQRKELGGRVRSKITEYFNRSET